MTELDTSGKMQVNRRLHVAPRRTPQAAWSMTCRFVTNVLEEYGFQKTREVEELLVALAPKMAVLLLMRAMRAIRLSCPSFVLELSFDGEGEEWEDRFQPPTVFDSAPEDCKPVLTFLLVPTAGATDNLSLPVDGAPIHLEIEYVNSEARVS